MVDVGGLATRSDAAKAAGNEALRTGDAAAAVKHYSKALSLAHKLGEPSPTEKLQTSRIATLYANRCQAQLALGDERAALADAEAAAREAPDWPKAHFRLGSVHMKRRSYTQAYSSFKRGWHIDTSNVELTKACQQAHQAMVGLDTLTPDIDASSSKPGGAPMSQEDLFKLREQHARAANTARQESRRSAQTLMSASTTAPVANPAYREEALKRTAMMAAGEVNTTAAAEVHTTDVEAVAAPAAVDVTDAAAEEASTPAAASGSDSDGVADVASAAASLAPSSAPLLEYTLIREAGAHSDGRDLLVATVHVPMAPSMKDLTLSLSHAEVRVEAEGAAQLDIALPARVDDEDAKAKYDKKSRTLTVRMPISMC